MPHQYKPFEIVLVDDVPENLHLLSDYLTSLGYGVRAFPDSEFALSSMRLEPPNLILLDVNMPGMSGYELCSLLKGDPQLARVPVIFISGLNSTESIVTGFETGAVDYVTKPFKFPEIGARVRTHLELQRLQLELRLHNDTLQQLVEEKMREVLTEKENASRAQLATIVAMSKLAEARDDDTGEHIERTREFCRAIAEHLFHQHLHTEIINESFIANIFQAAPLHDIGKVAIPDAILNKPGRLTEEESLVMRTHAEKGAETLRKVSREHPENSFLVMGISIAESHHERWDGAGYPNGIAGENIPLSGRIMAVADVYDALRSPRCYKPAFSHEKAVELIREGSGSQFDPEMVQVMLEIEETFRAIYDQKSSS